MFTLFVPSVNIREKLQGERLTIEEAQELVEYCNAVRTGDASVDQSGKKISTSKASKDAAANIAAAAAAKAAMLAALPSQGDYVITYQLFCNVFSNLERMSLFKPERRKVYQDMTLPLSYYYMASSHNTYLEGDQLTSHSSIKRYVDDLSQGCRYVS